MTKSDVEYLQPAGRLTVGDASGLSPSHCASRPCSLTCRSRSSVCSRSLRGVTTSRSSPWRSTVRRSGTRVSPSRMTIETDDPVREPQLTDLDAVHLRDRADGHLQQVGGDPFERRRLHLQPARLGAPGDLEHPRHQRQGRAGEQGVDHDHHEDHVEEPLGAVDTLGERDGGQHDRHRAAQAGPRDEAPAPARASALHDRADHHRQRSGDEGQDQSGGDRQADVARG